MRAALALVASLGAAGGAAAQQALTEDFLAIALAEALGRIEQAQCAPDAFCAPATPQELADPPLTMQETRRVATFALVGALGERCGEDWIGEVYLPMMRQYREEQGKPQRTMALIGTLFGLVQEIGASEIAACREAERAAYGNAVTTIRGR